MNQPPPPISALRLALHGLAFAAVVALMILSFRAYQDVDVLVPIINTFSSMCG